MRECSGERHRCKRLQARSAAPSPIEIRATVLPVSNHDYSDRQVPSKADAESLTMRVLTGALSVVGNPAAQAALVSAIKARSTDWPALSMLIPALDEASAPTPLAEETTRELASQSPNPDIASTAQL